MPREFTGSETAADVIKAVLEDFSLPDAQIVYDKAVPYLVFRFGKILDSKFRVDRILLETFSVCEAVCDSVIEQNMLSAESRDATARYLAYASMTAMLIRLPVLQVDLFMETFEDGAFLAPAILIHSIARERERPETFRAIKKELLGST